MSNPWIPAIFIFAYLAVVLYIGIFAFRKGRATGEDFFLASRSIGSIVFFLSLFATNMTSFAILGSSGAAYRQGIGIFGMMATSSCLVIPLTLFFIGTRLWAVGKRFGHMTQVGFFRDRFECSSTGTLIFVLTAAMLLPYLIISIVGGGTILQALTDGKISYPVGGAIVALVVMGTVFFGGMRGAVWVNVLQTLLFLSFGAIAFTVIGHNLPNGLSGTVQALLGDPRNKAPVAAAMSPIAAAMAHPATLLTRERIPWQVFLSFMLIPLSSIMFPHMSIMCFTAKKVTAFRQTVVLYPLCIMAIWLPCVFLGALAFSQPTVTRDMAGESEELATWLENNGKPQPGAIVTKDLTAALEKSKDLFAIALLQQVKMNGAEIEAKGPNGTLKGGPAFIALLAQVQAKAKDSAFKPFAYRIAGTNDSSVLLKLLKANVTPWLAGILAAGIISAVMGSDCHQILALSTMFTKDVFDYYGKGSKITEATNVLAGRVFIIVLNSLAYLVALGKPQIFDLAVTYAFAGFAAMSPVMIGALFWRRSTKLGVLASTLWVIGWMLLQIVLGQKHLAPGTAVSLGGLKLLMVNPAGGLSFFSYTLVVPMALGSAILMVAVSLITPPPSAATVERYFPKAAWAASTNRGFPIRNI
jgi:Na+/proline symporter